MTTRTLTTRQAKRLERARSRRAELLMQLDGLRTDLEEWREPIISRAAERFAEALAMMFDFTGPDD